MTETAQGKGRPALAIAGGIVGVAAVALLALYVERGAVGAAAARAYLQRLGVPAEVTVDHLSLSGLSASVRIGPSDHPDLRLDHVEVDFAPAQGLSAPKIASVRMTGAEAHIAIREGKPDFGRLQPLINALSKPSKPSGPPPDIRISAARLFVDLDGQTLPLTLAGSMQGGRLQAATVKMAPTPLTFGGTSAGRASFAATIIATAAGYDVRAEGAADRVSGAWGAVEHPAASLRAMGTGTPATGVTARGSAKLEAARFTRGTLSLHDIALGLEAPEAALDLNDGPARLVARIAANLTAAGEVKTAEGPAVLSDLRVATSGTLSGGKAGFSAAQTLSASGVVEPPAGMVGKIADGLSGDATRRADLAKRLHRVTLALTKAQIDAGAGRYRLTLSAPMTLDADHVHAALSSDAAPLAEVEDKRLMAHFAMALAGEGLPDLHIDGATLQAQDGAVRGDGRVRLRLDVAGLRALTTDQAWTLASQGGSTTLRPKACVHLTAEAVAGQPKDLATGLSGDLCEGGGPLVLWRDGRGRLAGRLERGAADIPTAQARVSGLTGDVTAGFGGADGVSADVRLSSAAVEDQASPKRFRPMTAEGALSLKHQQMTGGFDVAEAKAHRKIAHIAMSHDLTAKRGSADVVAGPITFSPDGLQPGDLSVAAAKMIWKAAGTASFHGRYDWSQAAPVRSSGDAKVDLSDFQISAGKGHGLSTTLHLTSLGPVESAPDQIATIGRIDGVAPMTSVRVRYHLGADALTVAEASTEVLGGRAALDPMQLLLAPGSLIIGKARVFNLDIGALLKGTDMADSITLDTRVSGVVPFKMTPEGLRVSDGRLASVSGGRLTIHRKALAGPVIAGSGTMQDIAWQALQDLAFDQLDLVLESRPEGRLGLVFHIRGKHDPKSDKPAVINLIDVVRGRAASTPMTLPKGTEVNLTLDSSINFDELLRALPHPDTNRTSPDAKVSP